MLRKKALSVCFINEKELWNKNGSQVRQRLYTERLVHQQHFNGSPSFLLLLFWYSNFNRKQKREPKYAARIYTFYCKLCYAMLCSFPLLCHDLIRHPKTIYSSRQKRNEYRRKIGSEIRLPLSWHSQKPTFVPSWYGLAANLRCC